MEQYPLVWDLQLVNAHEGFLHLIHFQTQLGHALLLEDVAVVPRYQVVEVQQV